MLGLVDSFSNNRQLIQWSVGIHMGTNCAPLLADLFLYSYENELLDKLIKEGKRQPAKKLVLKQVLSLLSKLISIIKL